MMKMKESLGEWVCIYLSAVTVHTVVLFGLLAYNWPFSTVTKGSSCTIEIHYLNHN